MQEFQVTNVFGMHVRGRKSIMYLIDIVPYISALEYLFTFFFFFLVSVYLLLYYDIKLISLYLVYLCAFNVLTYYYKQQV